MILDTTDYVLKTVAHLGDQGYTKLNMDYIDAVE
jgi:hypothetical protein